MDAETSCRKFFKSVKWQDEIGNVLVLALNVGASSPVVVQFNGKLSSYHTGAVIVEG